MWQARYDALLPWALRGASALDATLRTEVLVALRTGWPDQYTDLRRATTTTDTCRIRATGTAWLAGWQAGIAAPAIPTPRTPTPTPRDDASVLAPRADGLPVAELLAQAVTAWAWHEDLHHVAAAYLAATRATHIGSELTRDDLHAAIQALAADAWAREELDDFAGWDDACWVDYLDLPERITWLLAALDVADRADPARCAELTHDLATTPPYRHANTGIPPGYTTALSDRLAHELALPNPDEGARR